VVLVEIAGELEIGGIDALRAELAELELAEAAGVAVDLTRCAFLDSSGVGLLLQLAARARGRHRLVVIAPVEHHRVLALGGLQSACVLASDVTSALAVFDDDARIGDEEAVLGTPAGAGRRGDYAADREHVDGR
jgi:anti-anti-sigma factor